jgi:hypothetical protein
MASFKDTEDREWAVRLSLHKAGVLKERFGLDLLANKDDLGRVAAAEPAAVLLVLDVALEEQLKERNLTLKELWDTLGMEEGQAAASAVVEALIDFFPRSARDVLKPTREKFIAAAAKRQKAALEELRTKIESKDFETQMERELDQAFQMPSLTPGGTSGESSGPSDSTSSTSAAPGTSPSASSSSSIAAAATSNGSEPSGESPKRPLSKGRKSAIGGN